MADNSAEAALVARLESVPFSRWHIRPRVIVGSATFFDAFDALQLASVLVVLRPLWGLTPTDIAALISVGYIGQFVGALLFGKLAEKYGRIPMVAAAVVLMSVMSLACAFTTTVMQLLVCRLIQGIGVGGEMPVAAAYINELSRAKGRGRFFLLYELIFPIGLLATGLMGALLVPNFGWQSMFVVGGVPGLVIAVLMLRLPESPRWLIHKGRLKEAETVIAAIEASTEKRDPPPIPAAPPAAAPAPPMAKKGGWGELLSSFYAGRTLTVWLLWASAYFVTNGLNNWMPTLYNAVYHLDPGLALWAAPMTNAAQVMLLLVCIFVIDRIGRRNWVITGFLAGATMLLVLGLSGAGEVAQVMVLATLAYGAIGSINAVLYLYTPEIYPTRMRAAATGAATCWLRLASAAAPWVVGHILSSPDPADPIYAERIHIVFLIFAGVALIGALAATRMLETRNRRLEDIAP
jgi:putative MFS transporter